MWLCCDVSIVRPDDAYVFPRDKGRFALQKGEYTYPPTSSEGGKESVKQEEDEEKPDFQSKIEDSTTYAKKKGGALDEDV
jgi:hypothetical protein